MRKFKFKFELILIIIFIGALISNFLTDKTNENNIKPSRQVKKNDNLTSLDNDVKLLKSKFKDIADINYCSNINTIKIIPYDLDFMNNFNLAVDGDKQKIKSWEEMISKTKKISLQSNKKIAIINNLNADILLVCQHGEILYDDIKNIKNLEKINKK
jgi:hypothetical protein